MAETSDGAVDISLLDKLLDRYSGERGVLISVLQKTQAIYGYLPREALQVIARRLGLSLGKVYGVATFYAQFYLEKRGRHVLRLCDGTACHVKGSQALLKAVEDELGIRPGQTTPDGEVTMEIVYCMGSCALAPVAVLDNQVIGRMQADALLRQVRKKFGALKNKEIEVSHGSNE